MCHRFLPLLVFVGLFGGTAAPASAQNATAIWTTVLEGPAVPYPEDWSDPANWDGGIVPDNGNGGFDWDVVVDGELYPDGYIFPMLTLSEDITIDTYYGDHNHDVVVGSHTLTVTDQLSGEVRAVGDGTGGAFVVNDLVDLTDLEVQNATFVHQGNSSFDHLEIDMLSHGHPTVFRNEGTLTVESMKLEWRVPPYGINRFENFGTYVQTGSQSDSGNTEVVNHGLLDLSGLTSIDSFRQVAGTTILRQGAYPTSTANSRWYFDGGVFEVEDGVQIAGPLDLHGTLVVAGTGATGTVRFQNFLPDVPEFFRVFSDAEIQVDVGGLERGVESDWLYAPSYEGVLDGTLSVRFVDGFEHEVQPIHAIEVIKIGGTFTGEFANAPDGALIQDVDGKVEFRVEYGVRTVTLTDFQAIVPPACSDGLDNDGDLLVDFPDDPGCADADSNVEDPQCDDGLDNDGDGRVDFDPATFAAPGNTTTLPAGTGDPACDAPSSDAEETECQDGIHNDGDGKLDYDAGLSILGVADPAGPDPQCVGKPWRAGEAGGACGLGPGLVLLLPALRLRRRRRSRPCGER